MVRIGIIGAGGYWGELLLTRASRLAGARVTCCAASRSLERLAESVRRCSAAQDIALTLSATDLVTRSDVDGVLIASPAEAHFEHAKIALAHGKHVFLEKPMCLTSADAATLTTMARSHQLVVRVDHTYLYSASAQRLKEWIGAGRIGRPLAVQSVRSQVGIYRPHGVLWDLAPHDLSLIRMLLPESHLVEATCVATSSFPLDGKAVADTATFTLTLSDGVGCTGVLTWCSPKWARDFSVIGESGMLLFANNNTVAHMASRNGRLAPPSRADWQLAETCQADDDPLTAALGEFVQAVQGSGERHLWLEPEFGVDIVRWVERLSKAQNDGMN